METPHLDKLLNFYETHETNKTIDHVGAEVLKELRLIKALVLNCCKCGLQKGAGFSCMRTDCDVFLPISGKREKYVYNGVEKTLVKDWAHDE